MADGASGAGIPEGCAGAGVKARRGFSRMYPCRWYASKAASDRDRYAVRWYPDGKLAFWELDNFIGATLVVTIEAWNRTDAHVDRLARDFIAHGVSPTTSGGRGVAPACNCFVSEGFHSAKASYTWDRRDWPLVEHEDGCVTFAFARAEARARRVVSR